MNRWSLSRSPFKSTKQIDHWPSDSMEPRWNHPLKHSNTRTNRENLVWMINFNLDRVAGETSTVAGLSEAKHLSRKSSNWFQIWKHAEILNGKTVESVSSALFTLFGAIGWQYIAPSARNRFQPGEKKSAQEDFIPLLVEEKSLLFGDFSASRNRVSRA